MNCCCGLGIPNLAHSNFVYKPITPSSVWVDIVAPLPDAQIESPHSPSNLQSCARLRTLCNSGWKFSL